MSERIMPIRVPDHHAAYKAVFSDTEKCKECQAKLLRVADSPGINRFCPICRNVYSSLSLDYIVTHGRFIDKDTYSGSSQVIVAIAQALKAEGYDLIALAEDSDNKYFVV